MIFKEVFKNDHFIIVDKAPLVLSVPGREAGQERVVLGKHLEEVLQCQIFPVHRLDYEVSGLIMYALNPLAHKKANAWFEKKEISKTYHALSATGEDMISEKRFHKGESYTWKSKLLRGKKRAYESPHGKESLTLARIVDEKEGIYLWEMNPVTGRSHQLRFELYRHHQPILNDFLYGANKEKSKNYSAEGIALRAFRLDMSKAPGAAELQLPEVLEIEGLKL